MSTFKVRLPKAMFCLLAGLAAIYFSPVTLRQVVAQNVDNSKLKQLQKEKLSILKEYVDHLEAQRLKGSVGFEELYEAHLAMHKAELDLCDSNQARIHVLEHLLGEARRREAAVAALGQVASTLAKHRARVDCLDIEIQLEQLKLK